jgi:hypothetical protein
MIHGEIVKIDPKNLNPNTEVMRLMFLHPSGQPTEDSKVDNACADQRNTRPPQMFID